MPLEVTEINRQIARLNGWQGGEERLALFARGNQSAHNRTGSGFLVSGFWFVVVVPSCEFRVQGSGFRVQGSEASVQGSEFWFHDPEQ